jgi:lysyl-tRNA synthetase, class I
MSNKHWAEQLADEIAAKGKPPYVIGSGITTSGPAHMGTLCEFLYPSKVRDLLVKGGQEAQFNFMADILDAFDSVPLSMQQYSKQLEPHLGKPLCDVPDPTGKSKSFGDHFLDEVREVMGKFGIQATIVRMNELYSSGKMDRYAKLFLENEKQAKEIVERSSGREEKKDWSAIMPICAKCGKIATTRVLSHDGENYEYVCDRDVKYTKGCGFRGKNSIHEHKYNLVWRLDWPARQDLFNTSCEGAGMDHFTKGGSRDTLEAIFREMFKKEPPIGYKFGFILFQGKKYSKSKGIGMGVSDLMALLPPEVITFVLARPDLEENKDISPTKESMLKMVEEYEQSQGFADKGFEGPDRAERKRALAYMLSGKRHWKAPFRDILMYHALHQDWDKVGELIGDAEGVRYLKPYLDEWKNRDFIPDEFNFIYSPKKAEGKARELFSSLSEGMNADAIRNSSSRFTSPLSERKGAPGSENS